MKDFRLNFSSLGLLMSELATLLTSTQKTYRVQVSEWKESRSLSQNSLYWKWLGEIDAQMPLKVQGSAFAGPELWHEVFKKYYCPKKTIAHLGKSLPVKSTKLLDVGEMNFYLTKIEAWAMDRGINLTIPESSEYFQLLQSQSE